MALTATVTSALRKQVESTLEMNNPVYVIQSPDKTCILILGDKLLEHILTELTAKRTSLSSFVNLKLTVQKYTHISKAQTLLSHLDPLKEFQNAD